jgi:CHAD domain-containing protein
MKDTPTDHYCLFGIEALRERLPALTQEIAGVRAAEDIEYIHRMRVASRRLRAALTLFEACLPRKRFAVWEPQIKRITRALGAARDTDVQIDVLQKFLADTPDKKLQPGIKRLLLRLKQQRAQLQIKVIRALDELDNSRVIDEMTDTLHAMFVQARLQQAAEPSAETLPEMYQRAGQAITLNLEQMLAYAVYVHQPDRVAELHAMRIAAKHLRYTLEIFAPLYDDQMKKPIKVVKEMQEMLGDIHDCDVWIVYAPQFLEEERERTRDYFGDARTARRFTPGVLALQADRQRRRDERYAEFVKFWERPQQAELWDRLREVLHHSAQPPVAAPTRVDTEMQSVLDTDAPRTDEYG